MKLFDQLQDKFQHASLALRIAVSSASFGLGLMAVGGAVGYWALSDQLDRRVREELDAKYKLVQHVLSEYDTRLATLANEHRFADLLLGHGDLHLALVDVASSRAIASSSPVALESTRTLGTDQVDGPRYVTWRSQANVPLASIVASGPGKNGQSVVFVLSQDLSRDQALRKGFIMAASIGLPLMILLVALGAWGIARVSLLPLRHFTRLASSTDSRTLKYRLGLDGLPKELRSLASDLNAMLDRIDEGMTRLTEFSGNLAHEMRTPVATMLGRSQMMLSQPRSNAELSDLLVGNIEELERLGRLISDMLFLARAEGGDAAMHREPLDLHAEALRIAEYLSLVADERAISVDVSGQGGVFADRLLIQRVITNVLTNAIRHAIPSSRIAVEIGAHGNRIELIVKNSGPGIASHQIEHLFARFYRVDPSRSRLDGGSGLGLAIVRSIMHAHGGEVTVNSEPGGVTAFTLSFPAG